MHKIQQDIKSQKNVHYELTLFDSTPAAQWDSVVVKDYLEGVLNAVSWLADPDGFQHACVSELSEHQTVVETQRHLDEKRKRKCEYNREEAVSHSVGRSVKEV